MRVSIKDVAEKAGVSNATVSRVFNGYTDVSHNTREKILKIAKELNYVPNSAARELSSKQFIRIALIINELETNRKNSIVLEILTGVHEAAKNLKIDFMLLFTTELEQKEISLTEIINKNNVSGAIIQGLKITDPYFSEIKNMTLPIALIDMSFSAENTFTVSTDNIQAAYDAVSLLIAKGHQKIGMIAGRPQAMVSVDREAGYIKCLKEFELQINDDYIVEADFNEERASIEAIKLINQRPEITALFVASDLMAIGAIRGLNSIGIRVPEDVSVIGFDDSLISEYTRPPLTTVRQNLYQIGYTAFEALSNEIKGDSEGMKSQYVPYQIIERESVMKLEKED